MTLQGIITWVVGMNLSSRVGSGLDGVTHIGIIYINFGFMDFCLLSTLSSYIKIHTLGTACIFLAFNWVRYKVINYYGI